MSMHTYYLENSPYYANLIAHHGRQLTRTVAEKVAREHGTTVAELIEWGELVEGETFSTLTLIQALGY